MNGMIPYRIKGFMKGDIKVFGKSIWDYNFSDLCNLVGLVNQNPIDQLVTFKVRDEIAFGLENLKYPRNEILQRVEEVAKLMEINHLLDRQIDQLSGGQKQIVVLSSFLVMRPKILILDEPIAFLDQKSESLLLERLKKLKKSSDYNVSIIIIEHRLSRVIDIADKLVILEETGNVGIKGDISEILTNKFEELKSYNVRVPWIIDLFNEFKNSSNLNKLQYLPKNFEESIDFLNKLNQDQLIELKKALIDKEINPKTLIDLTDSEKKKIDFNSIYIRKLKDKEEIIESDVSEKDNFSNNVILETKNLSFEYPNNTVKAINNISLKINRGDFIGLIGPNGSGKTTFLYLLANLYEPKAGEILYNNCNLKQIDYYKYAEKIGFIFQNPENMIFNRTIKEEILYAAQNFGIINKINDKYLNKLIKLIGNERDDKNPFNLSWGQKRRLNLSSVFVYNPEIILLDEPFIGQDQKTINSIIETLYIENKRGRTIIISSHDYHLLLKYTRRIIELGKDGTLLDYDENGNYFKKHKNLGPIILLEEIEKNINSGEL